MAPGSHENSFLEVEEQSGGKELPSDGEDAEVPGPSFCIEALRSRVCILHSARGFWGSYCAFEFHVLLRHGQV